MTKFFIGLFFLSLIPTDSISQDTLVGTVQHVVCNKDTGQQYHLYLPQGYNSNEKYPLLIFLDPFARGDFVLNKYRAIADKFGLILVGSDNSKNFDFNSTELSVNAIYIDIIPHYRINEGKIWLVGFSGGSRAASSFAIANNFVSGVIACGAGFANDRITSARKIPFAGIVGNNDMNYGELFSVSEYLDNINNENLLLTFNGGHMWPPPEFIGLAVQWLNQNIPGGKKEFSEDFSVFTQPINAKIDSGFLYMAYLEVNQLKKINVFSHYADSVLHAIEQNKEFKSDESSYEKALAEEKKYIEGYGQLFNQLLFINEKDSINTSLWDDKINAVKAMLKSKDRYRQLSGARCFDYSWRACTEYYYEFFNSGNYNRAYNIAYVYTLISPVSGMAYYMMARAAAGMEESNLVITHLKEAIKRGFTNKQIVLDDPLFQKTLSQKEIIKFFDR